MSNDTFHVTHWAGLDLARPQVMGILNVTPDSFSDGGRFHHVDAALEQAAALRAPGARARARAQHPSPRPRKSTGYDR